MKKQDSVRPPSPQDKTTGYWRPPKRRPPEPPPKNPIFDYAEQHYRPGMEASVHRFGTRQEREMLSRFYKHLPELLKRIEGGRAQRFYPYLLVRSMVGDHGERPFPNPLSWQSPDIWLARGDPSSTPAIPQQLLDYGGPNQPHTLYAHVWNLGHAPIVGAKIEFYLISPVDQSRTLLGIARVDLGSRLQPETCHQLVKCPEAWVPAPGDLWSFVVRLSSIGDRFDQSDPWDPATDRHVARLDIDYR